MDAIDRAMIAAGDWVRYDSKAKLAVSYAVEQIDRLHPSKDSNSAAESLNRLTMAARLGTDLRSLAAIEARIRTRLAQWSPEGFDWNGYLPASEPRRLTKSIILKRPRPGGEKGVLFISFEYNWLRLMRYGDLAHLALDYDIVLSPSFSPPQELAVIIAAKMWPGTLFTILSNLDDADAIRRLAPNIATVPLLASSWVDPERVAPDANIPKEFDVAVPANFDAFKRHFVLFRALRDMDPAIRVVLLGRAVNSPRENLERQARLYGVLDRITIKEGPPRSSWAPMLNELKSAKVSIILSLREGSNVSVTESIFSDIPVGLLKGARIGSRAFINSETGVFLRPDKLASDLSEFVRQHDRFRPRAWAMEHGISCRDSIRVLNDALKAPALNNGAPWSQDLFAMHWKPDPEYLDERNGTALRDEYQAFEKRYGIPVDPPASVSH